MADNDETRTYSKKQEAFFNAQMLKILGVGYAVALPFFTWIVVSIYEIKAEQAIQKEKIGTILEIKTDISSIKQDIKQLSVDVAILKSKGNP